MSVEQARPWVEAQPPPGSHCASWSPQHLRDLPAVRRESPAWTTAAVDGTPRLRENRVEESVLALDELMSNALRHGRAPIEVRVCASEGGVLLQVADWAAENPPGRRRRAIPATAGWAWG